MFVPGCPITPTLLEVPVSRLPLQPPPDLTLPTSSVPGVLVVDDDPAVRGLLNHVLPVLGFRAFVASNLSEAVALFDRVRPLVRIALLDVSMPGGNGPDVLRELRLLSPELPTVFMSGELDPDLRNPLAARLRAAGAAGLIAKPVRLPDLSATLVTALSQIPPLASDSSPFESDGEADDTD